MSQCRWAELLAAVPCHTIGSTALPTEHFAGPLSFPLPFHLLSCLPCCRSRATIDLAPMLGLPLGPNAGGAEMCHRCFHCQCPVQCGSCAASRQLPEPGSCNGNINLKPVDAESFSAELRNLKSRFNLVAVCAECVSLWGRWEETIILKSLVEWWLIRTVHHRETYSGVNRCLFCILQSWKKISKSTTGYSNLTCSAWEQQLTSPNLCPAA